MTKRVAVLGCGPAGLLAAHAAQLHGHEIEIYAPDPQPSVITGAQYLHSAINGITKVNPDGYLRYEHQGREEGYARKIYGGRAHRVETSWNTYPDRVQVPAWSLRQAYSALWRCYRHALVDSTILPEDLAPLAAGYDYVFSTAPRPLIQVGSRTFESVWIKQYPALPCPEQTIVYNGEAEITWFRMSNIFGHMSMEWPNRISDVGINAKRIQKPLSFIPNEPAPENVYFVGRYGQWQKGVLVDHVFRQVNNILDAP